MKIAWISYDFAEYCISQVNALAEHHSVFLALGVDAGRPLPLHVDERVDAHIFDRPRLRFPIRQIKEVARIVRRVRSFEPDIVHFQHGHFWFNFALRLIGEFPLIVTVHDPEQHEGDSESRKTPQALMKFGFRQADHLIVHGHDHIEKVASATGIQPGRVHFVPHVALGVSRCLPTVEEDANNVLFFGRIWGYKGLAYLIKAEPFVSRVIPDVRITIAGKGEDFEKYQKMMVHSEKFEIRNHWISDSDRSLLFQRAAVVALPYTSSSQSGVIPLAYQCGKPVIATNVGALPEYVVHGETGLIVPPGDENALADAIVFLLQNEPIRRKMGTAGRRKSREEWAPNVVADMTATIYKEMLKSRSFDAR